MAAEILLRPYQGRSADDIRGAFLQGIRSVLLVSPTSSGKCLGRGTPVLMFDGTIKPVETIVPGDLLIGPDSKPRAVLSTCAGFDSLFRVMPSKGDPYVVNADHILSLIISGKDPTSCGGRSYQPGSIANVAIADYLASSKTFKWVAKGWRSAASFRPVRLHPNLPPYMLGLWLGDGSARHFSISKPDLEIKEAVCSYADSIGMAFRQDGKTCPTYHVISPADSLRGRGHRPNRATNVLREVGVLNNKHIPHSYKTASIEDRLKILAGLLDADGYLNASGGFDFISIDRRLSEDVVFVSRSLGLAAYMSACEKRDQNGGGGTYWRVYISGETHKIPTRIPRKIASQRSKLKDVLRVGISVTPIGQGPYHGFTLDRDGLFLLGDFTVTHNTVTFSHIAKGAAIRNNRTLIAAHRDFLIKQASGKLSEYGVGHGIVMADYSPTPHAMVQVGSVQTLVRRLKNYAPDHFQLIIIDEAHLSAARSYLQLIDKFPKARILGVTGSPCRLDGRGLGSTAGGRFDYMVESITCRELIDDAYATQPIVFAPLDRLNLSKVPKKGGDYDKGELSRVMNTRVITGNAIDHYREHAMHLPAATWCVDVEHARQTAAEFNAAGIKSVMIHGGSTGDERDSAMRMLSDGSIYNVTFCQLLIEGVDCPAISCIIGLRPTYSLAGYLQTNGRMLRPMYAKGFDLTTREGRFAAMDAGPKGRKCVFLDCAGLTFRHGFIDEVREWSLLGEPKKVKKQESVIAIRQCPKCRNVFPPLPVCPNCGHVFVVNSRVLEHEDGKLGQLTPEMVAQQNKARRQQVGMADTREQLEQIAEQRGYSRAWVDIQLRIKAARKRDEDDSQKKLWLEQENQLLSTHPRFKPDADWPEF